MANSVLTQTLIDGPRNAVIKITGILDTSNVSPAQVVVNVSSLSGSPTSVRIDHIDYSIQDQLEVQLLWDATAPVPILPLAGRGKMSFWPFAGLQNNAGAGKTGNITLQTTGWTSGTQVFSIVLEMVKQGNTNG